MQEPEQLWLRVLDELGEPVSQTVTDSVLYTAGLEASYRGLGAKTSGSKGSSTTSAIAMSLASQAIKAIKSQGRTLMLDDFHYVPKEVKKTLAEQLKGAVHKGMSVLLLAVPHRSDDAIRSNPDLRGRVEGIEIAPWGDHELRQIGEIGFPLVGLSVSANTIEKLVSECLQSPLLMQALCLELCYLIEDEQTELSGFSVFHVTDSQFSSMARRIASKSDARSVVETLAEGPPRRGTARTAYKMKSGSRGDNYDVILNAMALDPPQLSLSFDDLMTRVQKVTDDQSPSGQQISTSLGRLQKIVDDSLKKDRVIDWESDKRRLTVIDPYFLFYLRWAEKPNLG